MRTRVITGLVFGIVVIAGILGGTLTTILLLSVICFGCTYELLRLSNATSTLAIISSILALLFFLMLSGMASFSKPGSDIWTTLLSSQGILASIWAIFSFAALYAIFAKKSVDSVKTTALALVYISIPCWLYYLSGCLIVDEMKQILLGLIFLIWASDSGAYFAGKSFGKTALAPAISPKKTVEGLLGGLMLAVLAGIGIAQFTHALNLTDWITLAVIITLFGICGDLFQSKMKREKNVKDSGTLLPGHGGFLDRFDAFLFAMPPAFIYIALNYL